MRKYPLALRALAGGFLAGLLFLFTLSAETELFPQHSGMEHFLSTLAMMAALAGGVALLIGAIVVLFEEPR